MKTLICLVLALFLCATAQGAAVMTPRGARALALLKREIQPSDCSGIEQREDNDQPGTYDGSYCHDDGIPDCQILVCQDGADACFGKGSCTKPNGSCGTNFPADVYDDQGRLCSDVCDHCSGTVPADYSAGGKNQGGGPPPSGDGGEA